MITNERHVMSSEFDERVGHRQFGSMYNNVTMAICLMHIIPRAAGVKQSGCPSVCPSVNTKLPDF